jgi:Flp pilus assembly protein TadB
VEILLAIIGALGVMGAAAVTASVPLISRRTRGAVEAEGVVTREAVAEAVTALGSQLNARIEDVRDDLDEVRENLARVREWQAGHDAEHLLIGRRPDTRGD